jgi:hypothetical protein
MPTLPLPPDAMAWMLGVGLLLLFAAVHLLGGSASRPLDAAAAQAAYRLAHPEDDVLDVVLADDGAAALLPLAGGCGLVFRLGRGTVVRRLAPGTVRARVAGPGRLRLELRDPACPRVELRLAAAPDWADRLGAGA